MNPVAESYAFHPPSLAVSLLLPEKILAVGVCSFPEKNQKGTLCEAASYGISKHEFRIFTVRLAMPMFLVF
jgi:hypothetical protein